VRLRGASFPAGIEIAKQIECLQQLGRGWCGMEFEVCKQQRSELTDSAVAFIQQREVVKLLGLSELLRFGMAESRQRLEDNLVTVSSKARERTLPDVTLENGELRIAKLRKNTPESAEAFAEKAYALLPHVKITELFAEVDQWTNLGDRFVHLRTLAPPKNRQALLTAILADAINLGLVRMAEACRDTTWRQLCWDGRLAHSRRMLRAGPRHPDRCAKSPAAGGVLGQRHHFLLGRSVLSSGRPR
jgi:hypothetical protein